MTGYATAEATTAAFQIDIELRSVNHRFLDLNLRLPPAVRSLEGEVRRRLAKEVRRGRIELNLGVRAIRDEQTEVLVRPEVARVIRERLESVSGDLAVDEKMTLAEVAGLPGVVEVRSTDVSRVVEEKQAILEAVGEAVTQLCEQRSVEGKGLREVLLRALGELQTIVSALDERRSEIQDLTQERLHRRLRELIPEQAIVEERVLTEVALLVERSDVTEEIDRLRSHLDHFRESVDSDQSVGKRLDFVAQEILRELNTLGSKVRDSWVTRQIVDAKVLCEQLREQVQNVE